MAILIDLARDQTFWDVFCRRAQETPQRPAYTQLVDQQWRTWTWAEVAALAARWRGGFQQAGLKPGDRVAICARNRIEWVCFDLAAIAQGLVTVPLYFDDRA